MGALLVQLLSTLDRPLARCPRIHRGAAQWSPTRHSPSSSGASQHRRCIPAHSCHGCPVRILCGPALGSDRNGDLDDRSGQRPQKHTMGRCFRCHCCPFQPTHSRLRHAGILGTDRFCRAGPVLGRWSQTTRFETGSISRLTDRWARFLVGCGLGSPRSIGDLRRAHFTQSIIRKGLHE